ncbi:hypothetical protein VIGAN_11144200 [Vigna angularis var. angularis]|uniref:Leucine-rich repeat-containing N-terminal plant-type domain-containing protein n=1 Tax=Vigna angularis var. angularis TaxID=157739 RepID=A0A0S3T9X4_PHAAN|nr:hypothetical protein VIGAN_11144200 [Vigna angularis var. angularis]
MARLMNRGRFSPSPEPHFPLLPLPCRKPVLRPNPSALSALRHLNLSNNAFNATFPSNLANLQVLDLYNNNMTGPLPLAVAAMPLLRHLHLEVLQNFAESRAFVVDCSA